MFGTQNKLFKQGLPCDQTDDNGLLQFDIPHFATRYCFQFGIFLLQVADAGEKNKFLRRKLCLQSINSSGTEGQK
ncbi:MAG: hypothetical protein ACI4L7_02870 [Christensenellales bacterium]